MKEAAYLSQFSNDIEKKLGGKVIKISDKSTLGLPDSMWLSLGIAVFIESKIENHVEIDREGRVYVQPWRSIKKDIRQYEVCKSIAQHSCVVFAIYYPSVKMSAILPVEMINQFKMLLRDNYAYLCDDKYLQKGRGLEQFKRIVDEHRKEVHGKLDIDYGRIS